MKQDEINQSEEKKMPSQMPGQNPYNQGTDDEDTLHLGDTRKPKLTLKHLNKLRKMKELRRFEKMQQSEFHQIMYGIPEEEQSPLG